MRDDLWKSTRVTRLSYLRYNPSLVQEGEQDYSLISAALIDVSDKRLLYGNSHNRFITDGGPSRCWLFGGVDFSKDQQVSDACSMWELLFIVQLQKSDLIGQIVSLLFSALLRISIQ